MDHWLGGRPRKTTPREDILIVREVAKNQRITVTQIKKNLGMNRVSDGLILDRIKASRKFKSYWSRKKPYISEKKSPASSCLVQRALELDG